MCTHTWIITSENFLSVDHSKKIFESLWTGTMDEKLSHPDITSRKGLLPSCCEHCHQTPSVLSPFRHCLGCKELPPTSRLDLALPRRQDATVDTRGKRPDCFVPNQDNAERHFNFISPLGVKRDYCSGLPKQLSLSFYPVPLLSPTDVGSTALPTTHWPPLQHLLPREYNLWYPADGGTSSVDQVSREGQTY